MEKGNNAKLTRMNNLSYQLGRMNKIAVPDLYPVIDDLQKILLRGRDGNSISFVKAHASISHRYPINGRVQIIQPIGRGLSTMKGLLAAQYSFHLLLPRSRYLHSRGLRPARRNVVISNYLVRLFRSGQAGPHELRSVL